MKGMKGFNYRKEDAVFTEATNVCGCKVLIKIQPTSRGTEVETKLKYCSKHENAQRMYEILEALTDLDDLDSVLDMAEAVKKDIDQNGPKLTA